MTSLVREQTMLGPRTVEDLLMIDQELWTPVDFAKERVFEAVSTGKFYILVRLRA